MKEFRIMAYFSNNAPAHSYQPRSFKRKIYTCREEADEALKEAREYYSKYRYIDCVRIEQRNVSEWEKSE